MKLQECGKNAEEIKALNETYMISTYARFDFVCESASGMYLYDENHTPYLDFYGGIAVNSTGNCNEKVVEAVREQALDVIHTFNYPHTIPQALLAEKICTTLGYDKIFYQNSGAEANEAMIKMARKYGVDKYGEEHYQIITAKNSFHGRTYGALSATGQPDNACQIGFKPMLPGFQYADFNDVASFRRLVTKDTTAIMLEPIQGEGGVLPATQEFMTGIADLCKEHDILLLVDEIQTGWCRTGEIMGYMHYGIKPDIVSMAKAMGGGMPISAIVTSEAIAQAFSAGSHGTTYGGNAVCCAASLAQITELLERDLAKNAAVLGERFMEQLRRLPGVKEVRGRGLLVGVEYHAPVGAAVKKKCLEKKLLVTLIGDRIIRMVPPLILTQEHVDQAVAILDEASREVSKAS
ncbi:MAG: aspartate aminotransferase family protein [Lachnospiraceae bacterium]